MASPRPRPFAELGLLARVARERAGLTQVGLRDKTGLRNELISRLELGENVEVEAYERVARGLGFKGALEMFMSAGDLETARLLRYWRGLSTHEARRDALRAVKQIRDADEAVDAT